MWTLKRLRERDVPQACINGKCVPARPENYKKSYASYQQRFKDAWAVFMCRAEAFKWCEGQ